MAQRWDSGADPSGGRRADAPAADRAATLVFGAFALRAAQRRLERDGRPIALGDKAFEVLRVLVGRAGEVVSKSELLDRSGIATEDSLRFHIIVLRKALGEGRYIANVAGQGYSFVAPVSRVEVEPESSVRRPTARPLPARPLRLLGRDLVLIALGNQLLAHRFVTVVGPGGVGKTSVALTLAHNLATRFDGDVCFFDVGGVFNPDLLSSAVAAALGIPLQPGGAAPGIVTFLRRRRMLLVLDGCEAGVDAAAALAEALYLDAPQVHVLATSREALRATGEQVHRLFPLDCPAPGEGETAQAALGFAAVQLFVQRAASGAGGFDLTNEDAPIVSEICRKLDGLALAIELAAGRVEAYGIREVSRQLETQFALMWPGRRTAVARHQTLSATLDWSHRLLTSREQIAFRRLSVFAGVFTLEMAADLIADEEITPADATEAIGSLVAKSLVHFNAGNARGAYRLLDMTRSYAFDRLKEAGGAQRTARRHAEQTRQRLQGGPGAPAPGDVQRAEDVLDDVSAALEWSVGDDGDPEMAAGLAAASAPLWLKAGKLMECRYWMNRVLKTFDAAVLGERRQLALQATLASAETFTQGFTSASFSSWQSAFAIAASVGDLEQQLISLVVLWAHRIRAPDFPMARALAQQAAALAAGVPDDGVQALAQWMVGISHHHQGELATARTCLQRSLTHDSVAARQAMMTQFGYDRRIPSMGVLSNLMWLEGQPDEAVRLGAAAVAEARRSPYPVPLCEALTWQALTLHLRGDDADQVEALLDETLAHARPHFIESYVGLALALKGLNAAARGLALEGRPVLQGLALLSGASYEVFHPLFRSELARRQAQAGLEVPDEAVAALLLLDAERSGEWSSPEVKRNLGEVLLRQGEPDRAAALFAAAEADAARQGAVGWALRIALSLAHAARDPGARRQAQDRLKARLAEVVGGDMTADVAAARRRLAERPAG